MSRSYKKLEHHHLIPKSRRDDGFDVDAKVNITKLRRRKHDHVHRLYENMLPQEQLKDWLELNSPVLSTRTRDLIQELIDMEKDDFYNSDVLTS